MTEAVTCPPLDQLAAFADGNLGAEERRSVLVHLADCPRCRELVSEALVFIGETPDVPGSPEESSLLGPDEPHLTIQQPPPVVALPYYQRPRLMAGLGGLLAAAVMLIVFIPGDLVEKPNPNQGEVTLTSEEFAEWRQEISEIAGDTHMELVTQGEKPYKWRLSFPLSSGLKLMPMRGDNESPDFNPVAGQFRDLAELSKNEQDHLNAISQMIYEDDLERAFLYAEEQKEHFPGEDAFQMLAQVAKFAGAEGIAKDQEQTDAIEEMKRLKESTENLDVLYNLASMLHEVGRTDEAVSQFRLYLEKAPESHIYAEYARQIIQQQE